MVWEMMLGDTSGTNKLWMNNELILDEDGVNMPLSAYAGVTLDQEGVDRIQAGVTANSNAENVLLYLDNVDLTVTFR